MVSKEDLGAGYLIAVGICLFTFLKSGLLAPSGTGGFAVDPNFLVSMFAGLTVAGGFTLTGIFLVNSGLPGERMWRVAQWGTVGLGVPTMLIVFVVLTSRPALESLGWQSTAAFTIAGGGFVGILPTGGAIVTVTLPLARDVESTM